MPGQRLAINWEDRKADAKQLKYLLTHKYDVYTAGRQYGAPR